MARPKSPKYGTGMPGKTSRPSQGAGLSGIRTQLYGAAKILGDVSAIQSGRIGERVVKRVAGKASAKGMTGFFGKMF